MVPQQDAHAPHATCVLVLHPPSPSRSSILLQSGPVLRDKLVACVMEPHLFPPPGRHTSGLEGGVFFCFCFFYIFLSPSFMFLYRTSKRRVASSAPLTLGLRKFFSVEDCPVPHRTQNPWMQRHYPNQNCLHKQAAIP